MSSVLRGDPVPLEWTNWLLRDWLAGGFYLRMDARRICLYFGYEDLVMVLPRLGRSMELTSRDALVIHVRALPASEGACVRA